MFFIVEMVFGFFFNVLIGWIVNWFDLKGLNYIVDGVCVFGLIVLEFGILEL